MKNNLTNTEKLLFDVSGTPDTELLKQARELPDYLDGLFMATRKIFKELYKKNYQLQITDKRGAISVTSVTALSEIDLRKQLSKVDNYNIFQVSLPQNSMSGFIFTEENK